MLFKSISIILLAATAVVMAADDAAGSIKLAKPLKSKGDGTTGGVPKSLARRQRVCLVANQFVCSNNPDRCCPNGTACCNTGGCVKVGGSMVCFEMQSYELIALREFDSARCAVWWRKPRRE